MKDSTKHVPVEGDGAHMEESVEVKHVAPVEDIPTGYEPEPLHSSSESRNVWLYGALAVLVIAGLVFFAMQRSSNPVVQPTPVVDEATPTPTPDVETLEVVEPAVEPAEA